MSDLWLVFVAGLLASFHCVGMCGPIVLAYSLSGGATAAGQPAGAGLWGLHLAYNGGRFVSYSPTVGQVERTHAALREAAFSDVRTFETLERELVVGRQGTRPSFEMLGHTGYITAARKLS